MLLNESPPFLVLLFKNPHRRPRGLLLLTPRIKFRRTCAITRELHQVLGIDSAIRINDGRSIWRTHLEVQLRRLLAVAKDDTQRVVLALLEVNRRNRLARPVRIAQDVIALVFGITAIRIRPDPNHDDVVWVLRLEGVGATLARVEVAAMVDNKIIRLELVGVAVDGCGD